METITNKTVTFTASELDLFAALSRDYNPLHMNDLYARKTPYGRRVVFGALGVLKSLEHLTFYPDLNLNRIRVEFHNAIFLHTDYQLLIEEKSSQTAQIRLLDDGRTLLKIDLERSASPLEYRDRRPSGEAAYVKESHHLRQDDIARLAPVENLFSIGDLPEAAAPSWFCRRHEQSVIMLTSYLIGMELPGRQALFSKLDLQFFCGMDAGGLFRYRAGIERFDQDMGLLFLDLQLSDADNNVTVQGKLQSFVRRGLQRASLERIKSRLTVTDNPLRGKTALVIGGSRGLGATFVQALALSGAHVYLNFARCRDEAESLQQELSGLGDCVTLVRGSVADATFCRDLHDRILRDRGSIDIVICNACEPPQPMTFSAAASASLNRYIQDNVSLVSNPMQVFLNTLDAHHGAFIAVSSIYVETGSKEFPQYLGLKNLVEGLVKSASQNYKNTAFILPRPPKLLTDMSNTPVGSIGAIAPEIVAAKVASLLPDIHAGKGNYYTISDFSEADQPAAVAPVTAGADDDAPASNNPSAYIAATFSADLVLPSLNLWKQKLGLNLDFSLAPYNQIFQELLSPTSLFNRNSTGRNIIFFRFEDWLPYRAKDAGQENAAGQPEDYRDMLRSQSGKFIGAIKNHRQLCAAPLTLVLCPSLEAPELDSELGRFFPELEAAIVEQIRAIDGVDFINVNDHDAKYTKDNPRDALRYQIGHIPYTDEYYHVLGTILIRRLFAAQTGPYKVIVLDCDNTLWSGVCEEAGAAGVVIDEHFQRFQQFLIAQQQQGMLLCLCSKNREQAVWDVFEQHPGMLLKKEHLVDHRINWETKSGNIRSLAKALNLGLDSFVFIDDNPVECAEVRTGCPEVVTIQAPAASREFDNLIRHLWILDKQQVTQEDRQRTRLYQEDKRRRELQEQSFSFADFIRDLNLEVQFGDIDENNLPRVSQLTKRTNQFNLSTKRRSESEITEYLQNGGHGFVVSVTDRFGDYGYVGVILAGIDDNRLTVDTFLLSCRVLGRGVEHRIASQLGKLAFSMNLAEVVFPYVKSKKNDPIARFLLGMSSRLGLTTPNAAKDSDFVLAVPAGLLEGFEFDCDPGKQADTRETGEQRTPDTDAALSLRHLEKAFETVIFKYSDINKIVRELGSQPDDSGRRTRPAESAGNPGDTLNRVKAVFSEILDVAADSIDIDEQLEVLVDESYKIVDLTVALKEKYPHIPQTLLFETRNLRDLVARINGDGILENENKNGRAENPVAVSGAARQETLSVRNDEQDIAIIGMNGIFPGADNLETFWDNLKRGVCSIGEVPENRWDINGYLDQNETRPNKYYTGKGGFIRDIFNFDNQFFSISPREAETMDPQQRLFLQTVWGLLEDAGHTRESLNRNTGVFVGVISSDYALDAYMAALRGWSHYRMSDYYQIPNRISYYFDLHGPSLAIDSACSSSASALHLACNSIRNGECTTAIVGGVNLISHPSRFIQYSQMQMISRTGICSPFSDRADGTLFGEGVCALLLKPLSRAIRDGDNIHGVIKSTAVNSGGKTNGFTVPNPMAHAQLIGRALAQRNLDPLSISYIEAHGTATSLGDPIEIRGLTEAFKQAGNLNETALAGAGEKWCALGSVKSNIGHLESAAAVAGIIKCLLQMKHATLVPTLTNGSLDSQSGEPFPPNARIPFEETPFKLQYETIEWKRPSVSTQDGTVTYPLRAGISSFGAGGSNSHIIIEETPVEAAADTDNATGDYRVIVLSARSESQLHRLASRLHAFAVHNPPVNLRDVAYTLHVGREHFSHRLAVGCRDIETLAERLGQWLQNPGYDQEVWSRALDATPPDDPDSGSDLPTELRTASDAELWVRHWFHFRQTPWQRLYAGSNARRISLPKTEFDGKPYVIPKEFLGDEKPRAGVSGDRAADNPFLGSELVSPFISDTLYTSRFDLHNLPYLTDHRIYGTVVVPASMYIAYALTLVTRKFERAAHAFSNLTFIQAMLPGDEARPIQFALGPGKADGGADVSIMSLQPGSTQWTRHFTGQYRAGDIDNGGAPADADIAALQQHLTHSIDVDTFYKESVDIGFHWGPDFQCIRSLRRRDCEALGLIVLPESLRGSIGDYSIHPAFLDACFQIFVPSMSSGGLQESSRQAYLPLGVDQVTFYREVPLSVWSHVVTKDDFKKDSLTLDITLYTESGDVVAFFKGMNVLRTSKQALMALTSQALNKRWCYSLEWQPLPDTPVPETQGGKTLIFLGHESNANAESCRGLHNPRLHVISDPPQSTGAWMPDGNGPSISFDSAGAQAYRRDNFLTEDYIHTLLTTAFENSGHEDAAIFYGLHPLLKSENDGAESIMAALQKNCMELQSLLRVIERLSLKSPPKVYLLSREAHAGDKPGNANPVDASLWSLGRVLALEYPRYWGGMIDIPAATGSDDWQRLLRLVAGGEEDHLLIRDAAAYAARLENKAVKTTGATPIRSDASYLVSGAFGNLGRKVVRDLVARGAKSLILLGRKEPGADTVKLLEELQQQNVRVYRHAVDLGDRDAVDALFRTIEENRLALKGVVHLAGALSDGIFANLDWQRFAAVLQPKVAGTWNLHLATQNMELDFFVLFSSASSLLGAPGQANYALANGFMDAFAAYRRQRNLTAISINWGPWAGEGMAADQNQSRKIWTNESLGSIKPEEGLNHLAALIQPGDAHPPQVAVLPYDWPLLLQHYPVPALPSILKTVASKHRAGESAQSSHDRQADKQPLPFLSMKLPGAEAKRLLTDYLRGQVRKILGFSETDDIDAGRSFLDMGFDSLMAVSFRTELANTFEFYLPATLIFDYPNLNLLADYIHGELNAQHDNSEQEIPGAAPASEETAAGGAGVAQRAAVDALPEYDLQTEEDFSALSQSEAEKLLENELDELERILSE